MSPKPVGSSTLKLEAMEKANKLLSRAMESLGSGLVQMKHVQAHIPDSLGPNSKLAVKRHVEVIETIINELAEMELSE